MFYLTNPRQFIASLFLGIILLLSIIRLVQKGQLDIAYCWLWLGIGFATMIVVLRYDWLESLSAIIGAQTQTTTLFLMAIMVILSMCLQFSLVISSQRRQIKALCQEMAIMRAQVAARPVPETAPGHS
jgi:bacteriorhodopsin